MEIPTQSYNNKPFCQTEETVTPVISPKATIAQPAIGITLVYDVATPKGNTYTFQSRFTISLNKNK